MVSLSSGQGFDNGSRVVEGFDIGSVGQWKDEGAFEGAL